VRQASNPTNATSRLFQAIDGVGYASSVFRGSYVMCADNVSAVQHGGCDGGNSAVKAFLNSGGVAVVIGEYASDERLSRSSYQQRKVGKSGRQLIQLGN
jgi:hypothetical protein